MSDFTIGGAASVFTGAIVYIIFEAIDALSFPLRALIAVVVALIALAIALAVARRRRGGAPAGGVAVGTDIKAKGDVTIEGIDVGPHVTSAQVGTRLKSGGSAHVRDTHIGADRDR